MLVCGSVKAQEPEHHYQFDYHQYLHMMTMVVQINIEGVEQQSANLELGSFNGSTVTGSELLAEYSGGYWRAYFALYYNEEYTPSFKVYNHTTGEELSYCDLWFEGSPITLTLVDGTGPGKKKNPLIIDFHHAYTQEIDAYGDPNTADTWYLVSTPVGGVSPAEVENMLNDNYDLYYFDQAQDKEWVNYKSGVDPGFGLVAGKGYLYANSTGADITFVGAANTDNVTVTLSKVAGADCEGWNLIGNPFAEEYEMNSGRLYYRMNGEGSDLTPGTGYVHPMEGVFVYAETDGETFTFTYPSGSKSESVAERVILDLSRGGKVIDRVMVNMGEGGTLPKFMLDERHASVSIQQGDKRYAVVNGEGAEVLAMNFKSDRMCEYVLTASVENAEVGYMHLIDRLTGADIDMLFTGSYTFVGTPDDMESRFIIRFAESFDACPEVFAYQSGSDVIVSGEGTLQVYDVMGRFVNEYAINGVETLRDIPAGVYVFRIVGDHPRTQKIVVR